MSDAWSADDLMIVNVARQLCDDSRVLRRHRAAVDRREPRPPHARGEVHADLRVRMHRIETHTAPAVDRRRRPGRHCRLGRVGPRDLRLLASGGTRRCRLPRCRAARPVRQHQLDGDRRLRASDHATARRGRCTRDRSVGGRGDRDRAAGPAHLRRAVRLPHVRGVRRRQGRPRTTRPPRPRTADRHHRSRSCCDPIPTPASSCRPPCIRASRSSRRSRRPAGRCGSRTSST